MVVNRIAQLDMGRLSLIVGEQSTTLIDPICSRLFTSLELVS